jgi:hypothetical protein
MSNEAKRCEADCQEEIRECICCDAPTCFCQGASTGFNYAGEIEGKVCAACQEKDVL